MPGRGRPVAVAILAALTALAAACTSGGDDNDANPAPSSSAAGAVSPAPAGSEGATPDGSTPDSTQGSATGTAAAAAESVSPTPVDPGKPEDVAAKFLELWQAGDFAAASLLTDADPIDVQEAHEATAKSLNATSTTVSLGDFEEAGDTATAAFTVKYDLSGVGEWSYDNSMQLQQVQGRWAVAWTPGIVYPKLLAGQRLARTRTLPERAAILDAAGKPLFTKKDRITVGIEPRRLAADPAPTYAALAAITKANVADLKARVAKAKPDAFVPVITYTRPQFTPLDPKLRPLPGVIFRTDAEISSLSDGFARAVLGRVGEATAEVLDDAGAQYRPGDQLGLSGLQSAFQTRLTGTPTGEIVIKTGTSTVETVKEFAGEPPLPVKTTLDLAVQTAAERALGKLDKPAALVAVRASTGEVIAVANRPINNAFNRAFVGRYPPGSTMKVITTAALLQSGLKPTDSVPCPPTARVFGKTFRNFEGESKGNVPFSTDFSHSCNTAFVSLADRMQPKTLTDTAAAFGIGRDWKLPLPAYTGNVPIPKDKTELAASMIGQGQILVSPLDMALATAAVANGTWRSPVMVTDPAPEQPQQTQPLNPGVAATLRALMRQVVVEGTGKAAAAPGAPVYGKTGTAEFGNTLPLPTHAWFVGFRSDIAVAVIVEGGGTGGRVAAPIVGAFYKQLPG